MHAYYLKFRVVSFLLLLYVAVMLAIILWMTRPSAERDVFSLGLIAVQAPSLEFGENSIGQTSLPPLADISHIPDRKQAFVDLLLPMIREKNANLLSLREALLQMQSKIEQSESLSKEERKHLRMLASRYDLEISSRARLIERLLHRIDSLPESMVLAQAAAESGWGTSRFAREANNLFGQWCYSEGCGLVPNNRREGARHEVKSFDSVEAAVDSYYHNINTHRAYAALRELREAIRSEARTPGGVELVSSLLKYSERGEAYVHELQELIRYNEFERYDSENL